jgi:hypothetical protein
LWNADLVRANFFSPDAEAILNIPLRSNGGEDVLAWNFEKTGTYTVKSSYRALVIQKERAALDEGSDMGTSMENDQMWRYLWELKVLPKVRVFWWRVLRGILPDLVTLNRRHIKEIPRCEVCFAADEDLMHALISCSHAQMFWEEARKVFDLKLPRLHPKTWSKDIVCDQMFSENQRCTIISIMYSIWSSRKRITHDGEKFDPYQSLKKIKEKLYMLEFQGNIRKSPSGHHGDHQTQVG